MAGRSLGGCGLRPYPEFGAGPQSLSGYSLRSSTDQPATSTMAAVSGSAVA